ncbi:NAD(P)H-hydrate dehydratase [Portibacter lacus]|uniref:Bifunctional NAD(P)H-hydrate repair enzyme n=1 Tax=Portibacter lacus TaxID=1099794 RepID=A0AA37SMF3_9BACT|nr:NAD(P)H-hydrate dehydratase [Portibacter lacus]GLR16472.1 bifunctional NAD(P)H-hydrate repair enzyme [Portibacter lacus]
MKLLEKSQIRSWDLDTIDHQNISSFDLMLRAASVFSNWFQSLFFDKTRTIHVFCGMGNNGGDGFCIASLLAKAGYEVNVYLFQFNNRFSDDNLSRQKEVESFDKFEKFTPFPLEQKDLIIDALLGSGINGPLKGEYLKLVSWLNALPNKIISIDIPSGMDPDQPTSGSFVHADHVLSFEIPKISFFLNENSDYIKNWDYRSIHLNPGFVEDLKVMNYLIDYDLVKSILRQRKATENKKDFGFAQFCGGSPGMLGSVILASKAAMRCGLGRLAVSTPSIYHSSLFSSCPEAMAQADLPKNVSNLVDFQLVNEHVDAIAIGPGLSSAKESVRYIDEFLKANKKPAVLDADALNIISRNKWQPRIGAYSIISPHKEEFERLFGTCDSHYSRIQKQIEKSKELNIFIILKGAHTTISSPDGSCYYNNTGNVGMGTAGSGDVLTGMLLSFLAQGYTPLETCILAVYLHGSAGDSAAFKYGNIALIASDIIEFIPSVIKNINGK